MSDVPLGVRLVGPTVDRHVEHELTEDLTFSSSMPGGYKSCSFGLARPLTDLAPEMYPYTKVLVYDQRDGGIRWAGQLEVPGKGSPSSTLQAVGPVGHATDRRRPLVYVDARMSEWERVEDFDTNGVPNATVENTGGSGETPGIRVGFARGLVAPANATVTIRYPHLGGSKQGVGRATVTHKEGLTTANANVDLLIRVPSTLAGTTPASDLWNTGSQVMLATRDLLPSSAYNWVDWRARLSVGGAVSTDVTYSQVTDVRVIGTRFTTAGVELITAADYANSYVRAHEVVADLLGRLLPDYYPATVSQASAVHIDQLAYTDGTDPATVLDDLMGLDPSMRWAVWEPSQDGRWRFDWDQWPTTVALEADAAAGAFTSPGSTSDLFNVVRVKWTATAGRSVSTRPVWTTYTQAVPLLDQAGVTREEILDLGSQVGSQAQADAAGAAFLAAHAQPTNNGTLVVTQPIVDLEHGRTLQPWEIVAGPLIRVRNVQPSISALNVSDRNSTSVFRVAEVTYSQRSGAATLTLDSYSDSIVGALSALVKRVARVNRR